MSGMEGETAVNESGRGGWLDYDSEDVKKERAQRRPESKKINN
jgi:hypothetical protein